MDTAPDDIGVETSESQTAIFVRRWSDGDRSCHPKAPGILITTPYPGLRSFRQDMNRFFCGRETQKEDLKKFFADRKAVGSGRPGRMTVVVGGSGSGKSSLTRAGLIAELNTIPMEDQWGAWYVAEMRPEKNPVAQLQNALWSVMEPFVGLAFTAPQAVSDTGGYFLERDPDEKSASIRQARVRTIAAALELGIEWRDGDDRETAGHAVRQWLEREISPGGNTISSLALFDFVDQALAAFDTAASFGQRGGSPLLLLHIDQFEEVFRDECDRSGREALIKLMRDIHDYRPERLFAVATMRSEELHRFSEYAGMSEVINSSMYLVDLVAGDDIESAIVEPARRLAKLWDMPSASVSHVAPYTEEAVTLLRDAYREAGDAAQHKADRLPLLQHVLPLVWEKAVNDWIERRATDKLAMFEIGRQHLAMVPGWDDGRDGKDKSLLGRCLDARADAVFVKARKEFLKTDVGGSSIRPDELEAEVDGILTVAFCSLAQLDDRGQAVRKFVSVDQMLDASGGAARLGTSDAAKAELRARLQQALKKFENAGLVELLPAQEEGKPPLYNVTHESLIRNWTRYKGWLDEQERLRERLSELARPGLRLPDPRDYNLIGRRIHRDWAEAHALIQPESYLTLAKVFEDRSRYSQAWAAGVLEQRGNSQPGADEGKIDFPARIARIKSAWRDSGEWARWGKAWYAKVEAILMGVAAAVVLMLLAAMWIGWSYYNGAKDYRIQGDELRLLLAVNDVVTPSNGRSAVHDRALNWVIDRADEDYRNAKLNLQQRSILRQTVAKIDTGTRDVYGNEMTLRFGRYVPERGDTPAKCIKAGEGAEVLRMKAGTPVWESDGVSKQPENPIFNSQLDSGFLCTSEDGGWTVFLGMKGNEVSIGMQRMNIPTPLPPRGPRSRESTNRMGQMVSDPGYLQRMSNLDVSAIIFFHSGIVAGFAIPALGPPAQDGKPTDVILWSTTGLTDPEEVKGTLTTSPEYKQFAGKEACGAGRYEQTKARPGTGGIMVQQCMAGRVKLDADDKQLVIYRPIEGKGTCGDDNGRCESTIEIQYVNDDGMGDAELAAPQVRARIIHQGTKITNAAIIGDWLWIAEANGRTWRYVVGSGPIKEMLALRWQGTTWKGQDEFGIEYQVPESCLQIPNCKESLGRAENGWPGDPGAGQ